MKDINKNGQKSISQNSERVVRATFSLPGSALDEIEALRKKLALDGYILNKSEVVRIGLVALDGLPNRHAKKVISEIERLKAGRPCLIQDEKVN